MEPLAGITSCYRAGNGDISFDLPPDRLHDALGDRDGLLWVDIAAGDRAHGEPVLRDLFRFHQLTIDDCYNTLVDPPKVDDYGEYLFVIVQDVSLSRESERLETCELDLYVGRNYVVSVHRTSVHAVQEIRRRAEARALVLDRGAGFLAHALIDVVVDDFHPVVERLDDDVDAMQEAVLERPHRETLQLLLRLKRSAHRLKRSITPQRDVVNRFARREYPSLLGEDTVMYFRDVYDHTVRVDEMIETLRDMADSALNTYLSSVNNRTNDVMKALAIVAVIFLPLTLIAGIYGTNFENVPEYRWHWGYFYMLGVMGVITVALVAWFRWRRWF